MKNSMKVAALLIILSGMVGCTKAPDEGVSGETPAAQSAPQAVPQQVQARIQEVTSPLISSSVSTMEACDPVKAVLQWDVSSSHPTATSVQVWVGADPASSSLFSESGRAGTAETDAWVQPGATFRLVEPASATELARIVVGGPACN